MTTRPRFTAAQKAACAEREVKHRRSFYQRRALEERRELSDTETRQIAMMEEIAADYRRLELQDDLFGQGQSQ